MNMENKIKQNLPKGWRKVKLGKLLKVETGRRPSGGVLSIKSGIPSIGAEHLNDRGGFNLSSLKYIPADYFKKSTRGKIKENDILVVKDGATIGKVSRVSKYFPFFKAMVNEHVFIVRSSNENLLNQTFLFYKLFSHEGKEMIKSSISGSAQGGLKKDFLDHWETYIPPLSIQKRIAEILSAFDEKIELNNRINQILEEMAQAIFKEWFVKSEKLKMKSEKLSNLVDTQYGYTQTASDKEIGPKFLRVKDINKANWIDWNSVPYCRIGEENFKKYKLKKGDIVIARMADPGKVGIIEREINAVFGSYLIRLQIKSSKITPYFLYYYLKSPLYQNFILGVSTGTTRKSINAKMMVNCNILIPPREILEKFEMIISGIRQKINLNLVENQKLSALRDLLLPKLMSGEIRV